VAQYVYGLFTSRPVATLPRWPRAGPETGALVFLFCSAPTIAYVLLVAFALWVGLGH
jgi:hypothetical protein